MTLEELEIKFTADVKGLQAELAGVKKAVGGIEAPTSKATGAMGMLAKAGGMIAAVGIGSKLIGIGKDALAMANEVTESESLFEVSMGDMADSTRLWADELSSSLGVNAYTARKNVGVLNTMFKSMGLGQGEAANMAKELTMLSEDMASFYNLDPTEAFTKLQAGITGEAEGLKRLGILVDETTVQQYALRKGIIKQGQAMTNQQKVQARYGAILEQTGDAQGDLARTMDSPTNQLRKMNNELDQAKIALGQALQPALIAILPVLTGLATGVKSVFDGFKTIGQGGSVGLNGLAVSMDEARVYVKSVTDSTTIDLVASIENLDQQVQTALAAFQSAEDIVKQVNAEIVVNPPTTTGADRIRKAISALEETVKGYAGEIRKYITARLDAQLESGEITQRQYDAEIKKLNNKLARLETSAEKLSKTITAKLSVVLEDGTVTEKEAGGIEKAVVAEAERLVAAIEKERLAQHKEVDLLIKRGTITSATGLDWKKEIDAWANEAVAGINAEITAIKVEVGTLNWAEKTFTPEEATRLAQVITDAANAEELVVDAVVDRVTATWADTGALGEAVTMLFSDAKTQFETNNEELRKLAQSWIDGVAPTEEMWKKAIEIKERMRKLVAFMTDTSDLGAGDVVTAAYEDGNFTGVEGIRNIITAFDEYAVANKKANDTLKRERIEDLFKIDEATLKAVYGSWGEALAEIERISKEELAIANNKTIIAAAERVLPDISAAINSGTLDMGQLADYALEVDKMLRKVDFSTLTESGKQAVRALIAAFNTPELEAMFGPGGPLADWMDQLGETLIEGGSGGGGAAADALANGIRSKKSNIERAAKEAKQAALNGMSGLDGTSIGANFMQGVINGMNSKYDLIGQTASKLAGRIQDAMANVLEINSPSEVGKRIGAFVGEGLIIGMDGMAAGVYASSAAMANEAAMGLQGISGAFGGMNGAVDMGGNGTASAIANGIATGVQQVMDRMNIALTVDGEQFGRVAVRTINDTQRRAGQYLLGV